MKLKQDHVSAIPDLKEDVGMLEMQGFEMLHCRLDVCTQINAIRQFAFVGTELYGVVHDDLLCDRPRIESAPGKRTLASQ